MNRKAFLAVGHGGSDPGAVGNGFREKDLNLTIALACRDELERHGVEVGMSRTVDEGETLQQQVSECNAFAPEAAVCIHNNAGGGDGAEVYHHYGGGKGKTLAENILDEIVKIGQNSRGAKIRMNSEGKDYYGFIRDTNCPAVIVECAFLDNKKDIQIIDTEAEQKAMGIAVAKGILKTMGIEYMEPVAMCTLKVPVLKLGDRGVAVRAMQNLLIGSKISCGCYGADGIFGLNTDYAVRRFQNQNSLPVTGQCDQATWEKLMGII